MQVKDSPKERTLGRLIRGPSAWKVGPPFCFWWHRSCGGGSCPPMTLTVNRSRLAETAVLPSSSHQLGAWFYKFCLSCSASVILNSHMPNTVFSSDRPWHHLRKAISSTTCFLANWISAAVNSLLTASVHGNTDKLSLPVWMDKQIHCRVN